MKNINARPVEIVELILFLLIFTYMLIVLRGHTPFTRHA